MIYTYHTTGNLTNPVNDLNAAREWLREVEDMAQHIYPDAAKPGVHSVTWDLLDESRWEVKVVVDHELSAEQSILLSDWISGQNSDGIGEGFEQQSFAETIGDYRDEDDWTMSSFDWQTNKCELQLVKGA